MVEVATSAPGSDDRGRTRCAKPALVLLPDQAGRAVNALGLGDQYKMGGHRGPDMESGADLLGRASAEAPVC
jgi:hypothetical protein